MILSLLILLLVFTSICVWIYNWNPKQITNIPVVVSQYVSVENKKWSRNYITVKQNDIISITNAGDIRHSFHTSPLATDNSGLLLPKCTWLLSFSSTGSHTVDSSLYPDMDPLHIVCE